MNYGRAGFITRSLKCKQGHRENIGYRMNSGQLKSEIRGSKLKRIRKGSTIGGASREPSNSTNPLTAITF